VKRGSEEYKTYHREWKKKNPLSEEQREARRIYMAAYYKANPDIHRNTQLKRNYGINLESYKVLVESQNGLCAICKKKPEGSRSTLQVDHDHETGRVRGLLCNPCNTGLGLFKEEPAVLTEAIEYLRRYDGNA
jgi:Autographiviridae endonuclease VII